MSSDVAIKIEGLSKRYVLQHQTKREGLRHLLQDAATYPFKTLRGRNKVEQPISSSGGSEEFWALRDVTFEINRGDVIGIIGRNGAGKSTLLKVLSRIIEPTNGRVEIDGRVASLLEVGTGFHPELTGRENVFLNGAILGMSRAEVRNKFDEIVAFAEIEKFLDTPVKRYSSGMYVRLAFAVAAHLEPEILIVDEVLAVGDARFQQKCIGKLEEVAGKQERTVLFVSHNMSAISALCRKCAYLEGGRLVSFEETDRAIQRYLAAARGSSYTAAAGQTGCIRRVFFKAGEQTSDRTEGFSLQPGQRFSLIVEVEIDRDAGEPLELTVSFHDGLKRPIWQFTNSLFHAPLLSIGHSSRVVIEYTLPELTANELVVDLAVGVPNVFPYKELLSDALSCAVARPDSGTFSAVNPGFPLLLQPEVTIRKEALV